MRVKSTPAAVQITFQEVIFTRWKRKATCEVVKSTSAPPPALDSAVAVPIFASMKKSEFRFSSSILELARFRYGVGASVADAPGADQDDPAPTSGMLAHLHGW